MNGWTVTMGSMGQLALYLCSDSSKAPLAVYRGFVSFQDIEDFYTFGLLAPAESSPGYVLKGGEIANVTHTYFAPSDALSPNVSKAGGTE